MRKILILVILSLFVFIASAQKKKADSLIAVLKTISNSEQRLAVLKQLADRQKGDPVIFEYAKEGLELAKKLNNPKDEEIFLFALDEDFADSYNYPKYLETAFKGLELSRELKDENYVSRFLNNIAIGYSYGNEVRKAISYGLTGLHIAKGGKNGQRVAQLCNNISDLYIELNRLDSALYYMKMSYATEAEIHDAYIGFPINGLGDIENKLNHTDKALFYYHQAIAATSKGASFYNEICIRAYVSIAGIYKRTAQTDSAFYYAGIAYKLARQDGKLDFTYRSAKLLSALYADKNEIESLRYYKIADKTRQFQIVAANEQQRETDIKNAAEAYQNNLKLYGILLALTLALVFSVILWNSNKKQHTANKLLQKQQDELKATQNQLIQSEKMASLGELTAGIAHEIQNPLNFVNNFSEVNAELIDELKLEIAEGNYEEVNSIADDIKQNEQKINMHGKRADAIVKGMLQHSQSSSGKKEPTDINALADEYLRLSYHGLRAKNKTFNAELVTHYDQDIAKINVIPQDIGRVLLNLFNNAFYAVNQKAKTAGEDYKPEVTISTLKENGNLLIKVKDNGIGIPDAIKDKIMQPFFTTKPTGEGTGLGLSLTYDMVVKGHGGNIQVNSVEGEGSEFIISLPISS